MRTSLYKIVSAIIMVFLFQNAQAQDEGFIYGKVTTFENQTYEGPIRWGKEELYWIDVFNASKEENENLKYLSKDDKETLANRGRGNWSSNDSDDCCKSKFRFRNYSINVGRGNFNISNNWGNDYTHQFACQFGEIKSIKPKRKDRAEIELQGGTKLEVTGFGFNDIGSDIKVIDREIGEIELNWNRIQNIEFKSTPSKLNQKFGEPLFGTVESFQGSFKGAVQWDHEERISVDKLDGEMEDGNVSVAFGNIKSIERFQNRSKVLLKSGRELEMIGSNDVNSENRGIVVTQENGLMVDIPWTEFKKVTYSEPMPNTLKKYEDFKIQKAISGTVLAEKGKSTSGKTIFDLDEEFDFELFQGKDGDIEYSTAMRNVKNINAKDRNSVEVTLRNNQKLKLKGTQDVGSDNQGLLVFKNKEFPEYFPWESIIEFNLD